MNCSTIDIDELLRRGGGRILYKGPEGRIAQHGEDLILSDITSGKALCGCLSFLLLPEDVHFCVKSKDAADAVRWAYAADLLMEKDGKLHVADELTRKELTRMLEDFLDLI